MSDDDASLDAFFDEVNGWDDVARGMVWDGLDAEEEVGGLETCESGGAEWYEQARADRDAYLERVATGAGDSDYEDEADTLPATPHDPVAVPAPRGEVVGDDDVGGDFGNDRSASYGGSWEDDPLDLWQPEAILKRSSRNKEVRYLVKWRSHPDPTWELQDDLEEEGHISFIAEYHARKRREGDAKMTAHNARRARPPKPPPEDKLNAPHLFDPAIYWPDFITRIQRAFEHCNRYRVQAIYNCCSREAGFAFYNTWQKTPEAVPVMLYHGTRPDAIPHIANTGLRIPNTGADPVRVANGSAYGVGIYTATHPSFSHTYARGCWFMFVCCGLVGNAFEGAVREATSSIVVFYEAQYVVPCFLVQYRHATGTDPYGADVPYINNRKLLSEVLGQLGTPTSVFGDQLMARLRLRYTNGCSVAGMTPTPKRYIRSGGTEPGLGYDRDTWSFTKKQLRAAPRAAKEAYKAGLLRQTQSKK